MPRKHVCPQCGSEAKEPYKVWQIVAPIPDSKGRVTITIMGMFQCPNCGHKWRGVVSKIKTGGRSVEIEGKVVGEEEEEKEERRGEIIEIDIESLDEEEL